MNRVCTLCGLGIQPGDGVEWFNVSDAAHPECASQAEAELDEYEAAKIEEREEM